MPLEKNIGSVVGPTQKSKCLFVESLSTRNLSTRFYKHFESSDEIIGHTERIYYVT